MNRKQPPEKKNIEKFNFALPDKYYLDNGIPVYLVIAGEQEVVKIEFIFHAGISSIYIHPTPLPSPFGEGLGVGSPLIPKLTLEMLTEGTENYFSEEIAELLDYYSVFLDKDCERDKAALTVTCLNKHLENILPVLKEMILHPIFPASNFQLLTTNKRQHFILNNEKVSYIAKQQFKHLLYGDSPYGIITKLEDFDKLEREQLISFHSQFYLTTNNEQRTTKIIISGKPNKNIISLLNKYFGSASILHSPFSILHSPFSNSPIHQFIEKPAAVQSAVRIGKVMSSPQFLSSTIPQFLNYSHPDYYSFRILNTILGGYFGSRLISNIREDKGYTYGINSNLISLYNSAYFFITSQIGVEHVNIAISEIYKEMKRLQNDKVPVKELDLVRNYMQGNLLRSIDGPFAIAEMCKILIEYDLEEDYFYKYLNKIQNITSEEILLTAQKYLQPESMTELIVGNK